MVINLYPLGASAMQGVLNHLQARLAAMNLLHPNPPGPVPVLEPEEDPPEEPLNPLLVDEVLHTVFDYLDFRCLKKCRQVCKAWDILATKRLRLVLFGKYEEQQRESLEGLLTSVSLSSFIHVEVRGSFGVPISTFLHVNGSKIQELILSAGKQKVYCKLRNFRDLVLHAKLMLSVLEDSQYKYFRFLDVFRSNPLWPTVRKIDSDWETPFFVDFLELCPRLESIIIPSQKNYLQGMRSLFVSERLENPEMALRLKALKEINFHLLKSETEYLQKFNSFSWNLSKFEITVNCLTPLQHVRDCIIGISPTLQVLIVQIASLFDEYHRSLAHFRCDNWLIPTGLQKLKSLTITSVGNKKVITRSLASILHLKELQTLSIKGFAEEDGFENLAGNALPLRLERLTSLEVCGRKEPFLDAGFFLRPVNPWPNVQELKLTRPTVQVVVAIFARLPQIRVLDLLLESCKERKPIPWNSILGVTALDLQSQNYAPASQLFADVSAPRASIKALTNLKSLKINFTFDYTAYDDWKLTDDFIYGALVDLIELQYLHVTQHKFSDEGIEELRSLMRPFCNINIRSSNVQVPRHYYSYQ